MFAYGCLIEQKTASFLCSDYYYFFIVDKMRVNLTSVCCCIACLFFVTTCIFASVFGWAYASSDIDPNCVKLVRVPEDMATVAFIDDTECILRPVGVCALHYSTVPSCDTLPNVQSRMDNNQYTQCKNFDRASTIDRLNALNNSGSRGEEMFLLQDSLSICS